MEKDKMKNYDEKISTKYIKSIRSQIYKYMDNNDLTIRKFSDESELSLSTLNSLLYGDLTDCKLSTAVSLAKQLGISIDELVDAGTISESVLQNIITCRNLPQNSIYLIKWFIQHQATLYKQDKQNHKKIVSVMCPLHTNNELLKVTNNFRQIDISGIASELRSKVFFAMLLDSDYYMPNYSPYDVLLIANDRMALPREHVIILVENNIFIAKQRVVGNHIHYFGIRDGKFRCDETSVDEVIGYVAYVVPDTSFEGTR